MNCFLKIDHNTIDKLAQKLPSESLIKLTKEDLFSLSSGMDSYFLQEVKGECIYQVIEGLNEFFDSALSITKEDISVRNIGYQINFRDDLPFSEYDLICSKFKDKLETTNYIVCGLAKQEALLSKFQILVFAFG